jgi:hypothetical protein
MARRSRTTDLFACIALSALLSTAAPARAQVCLGDCDRDRHVTVDEIAVGVTYALGQRPERECLAFGGFIEPYVDVVDIITAVNHLLQGCGLESLEELESRRQENLAKWQDARIDDYEIDYQGLCFCFPQPVATILVRDHEIVSVRNPVTGEEIDNPFPGDPFAFNSIAGVFDIIACAIASRAARVDVEYHSDLGYPIRAAIDYYWEIADDEITIRITALRPLRAE